MQDFSDWELLLIDDGSSDGSGAQADLLAERNARISVLHQENRGQFYARQTGIEASAGEYLLFLDSDDALAEHALARIDTVLRERNPDMLLYTGGVFSEEQFTGRQIGYLAAAEQAIEKVWLQRNLLACQQLNSLCLKAFRRELFRGDETDYRAFTGACCGEDKARLLYPVTKAQSFWYIPDSLYRYNYRSESTMHRYTPDAIPKLMSNEMFALLRRYMRLWGMQDAESTELYGTYYLRHYLSVYYGVRKYCKRTRQRRACCGYPWESAVDKEALSCCSGRLLTGRERLKRLAAALKI